jgi:hypothetical protein
LIRTLLDLEALAFDFSDIGWCSFLKVAVGRSDVRSTKREALQLFHEQFAYLCRRRVQPRNLLEYRCHISIIDFKEYRCHISIIDFKEVMDERT